MIIQIGSVLVVQNQYDFLHNQSKLLFVKITIANAPKAGTEQGFFSRRHKKPPLSPQAP